MGALALPLALACAEAEQEAPELAASERAALEALGYVDWAEQAAPGARHGVGLHDPERSAPGYGLVTMPALRRADLIDAEGRILRSWHDPEAGHWERAVLCSNGDLVVVQRPMGLARFDWEGRRLWRNALPAHHLVVSGPPGRLLAILDRPRAVAGFPAPEVLDNAIALVSSEGELLAERSLWDALAPHPQLVRVALPALDAGEPGEAPAPAGPPDLFHANFLHWIGPGARARDPRFAPGRVLVTLRHQDAVVLLDWERGEPLWAWGQGELQRPHEASLTPDGTVLVFDNRSNEDASRVVEVDPATQAIVWQYRAPEPGAFFSATRGCAQRLANGNTLISDSNQSRAFEVTRAGEIVWDFRTPHRDRKGRPAVLRMVRYAEEVLRPLLAGAPRAPAAEAICGWL